MAEVWYSLKAASKMLGVHPVTLRRWAESGKIDTIRTPGGHRRFSDSEISRLIHRPHGKGLVAVSERLNEEAISTTRLELRTHDAVWISAISEKDREEKRLLGRRLMGLLMQYIASSGSDADDVMDEARIVSRIYAKSVVMSGITLQQALRAMNFFRDHILESAVVLPDNGRRSPENNKKIFRKLNRFLNEVQIVVADCFEKMGAVGGSGKPNE